MRTSVISLNMRLDDTLRRASEQRPRDVLGRISNRIRHVSLTLTDDNGPRGGVDKHCRVKVSVRGLGTIATEGRHEDVLPSVDMALRRARRLILDRIQRRVARSRRRKDLAAVTDSAEGVANAS